MIIVIAASDAAMPAASARCPSFGKYFSVTCPSSQPIFRRQKAQTDVFRTLLQLTRR
jgi:hypothetical protein